MVNIPPIKRVIWGMVYGIVLPTLLCIFYFVPLQHGYGAHVCLCRDGCLQHRQDSDESWGGTGESPAETGAQGEVFIGKDMERSREYHGHIYIYIIIIIIIIVI